MLKLTFAVRQSFISDVALLRYHYAAVEIEL